VSFQVTLKPADRAFGVDRDEADPGRGHPPGIGLPYGCRDGACGSCKSRLLTGRVIHGAHQLRR
jgi:CDP-4-dehydro-6-deoxyglucose reductase